MSVNTPAGQTDRVNIPTVVQQGSGWGPMECSVTMDKIGRMCKERGIHQYRYKGMVRLLPLACIDDLLGFAACGNKSIALNTFINTHVEMKKLRFHTPALTGKTKCHKIHVGKPNQTCPELRVHGSPMKTVESEKYLGDYIMSSGKNTKTIQHRVSLGNGALAQIKSMLENINLGRHYFKTAFLLRESIFLNGILFSSEAWYGLSMEEVNQLEKLDIILLRRIFEVPHSVPLVSLYLESGCIRIRNIIKARRLNFLHHLANLNREEMEYKFFRCQWDHPSPNDWTEQVRADLAEVGLPVSLEFLTSKSEKMFKEIVKKKIRSYEFSNLMQERKSKTRNLSYTHLAMQQYLYLEKMSKNEAIVLFKFRTRMAPFADNFKAGKVSSMCPLCFSHIDSQEGSFTCVTLNKLVNIRGKYSDIFENQVPEEVVKSIHSIYMLRKDVNEQ